MAVGTNIHNALGITFVTAPLLIIVSTAWVAEQLTRFTHEQFTADIWAVTAAAS
jgi:hypothetical protein